MASCKSAHPLTLLFQLRLGNWLSGHMISWRANSCSWDLISCHLLSVNVVCSAITTTALFTFHFLMLRYVPSFVLLLALPSATYAMLYRWGACSDLWRGICHTNISLSAFSLLEEVTGTEWLDYVSGKHLDINVKVKSRNTMISNPGLPCKMFYSDRVVVSFLHP